MCNAPVYPREARNPRLCRQIFPRYPVHMRNGFLMSSYVLYLFRLRSFLLWTCVCVLLVPHLCYCSTLITLLTCQPDVENFIESPSFSYTISWCINITQVNVQKVYLSFFSILRSSSRQVKSHWRLLFIKKKKGGS